MIIAHISDLHLNTFYRDSHLKEIKNVLRYCKDHQVDHIVITGDLTDNASEVNLNILYKSLSKFGYHNSEKLSVIIGNHDIFGGLQKAEDIFSFPDRCRKTDYNNKIKSFNDIFASTFKDCIYLGESNSYPYAKIIGDVLFVGINSNAEYSTLSNPFASNGEVSLEQFNETAKILNDYSNFVKYKIILIHHHFNKLEGSKSFSSAGLWQNIERQTMRLRKKKRLITLFKEFNVDLVLHGHLHITEKYEKKGVKFLNAGGSIKSSNSNKLKINIISIGENTIRTEIKKISPYQSKQVENLDSPDRSEFLSYNIPNKNNEFKELSII